MVNLIVVKRIRMKNYLAVILAMVVFLLKGYAQDMENGKRSVEINYRLASAEIDKLLFNNSLALSTLINDVEELLADTTIVVKGIVIDSYTSPEGGKGYNMNLAHRRTESVIRYIKANTTIADSLLVRGERAVAWAELRQMVLASNMKYANEIVNLIDNTPEEQWGFAKPNDSWLSLLDSRVKRLMDLRGGVPYKYMEREFFPYLRSSSVVTIYYEKKEVIKAEVIQPSQVVEVIPLTPIEPAEKRRKGVAFAVKTNLLLDLGTALNFELEVPIGKRWSLTGEYIFPWWVIDNGKADSKRHRLQSRLATVELRYWLGNREYKDLMTGWYLGAYGMAGSFDLEYNRKGIQSKNVRSAGLLMGYSHTINGSGSLRMEYALGLGYAEFDYKSYTAEYNDAEWKAFRDHTSNFVWFGPTKLEVSLVLMINNKRRRMWQGLD